MDTMITKKQSLPKYFDGFPIHGAQRKFLWIAAIAYAFDLMDNVIFSFVSPVLISNHGLTLEKLATLNSLLFIGMFIGGIAGGYISDKFGRKFSLLFHLAIFSLGSILNAFWYEDMFFLLEFSRFITGYGILGMTTCSMSYMSEMLPTEVRGKWQAFTLAAGTIMIPVTSILGGQIVAAFESGWRILLLIGGLGIFLVPLGMRWLLESPRWLISKGRVSDAEAVMEKALGIPVSMDEAYEEYKLAHSREKKVTMKQALKMMFEKKQRKQTIAVALICWGIACGNNIMGAYSTTFVASLGFQLSLIYIYQGVSTFGQPLGEFLSGFVSDKGGRIIPVLVFCGGSAIMLILAGMSNTLFTIYLFMGFKTLIGAGAMSLMYTYLAESFQTSIRGIASGIIFSMSRIILAALTFLCPVLFTKYGWFGPNAFNAMFFLLAAVVAITMGKKTAGVSLEDLHCGDACSDEIEEK